MIARIKTKDNMVYDTIVFAIVKNGSKSEMIGFNEKLDRLVLINIWSTHLKDKTIVRHVFILDVYKDNWTSNKNIEGFEWIIKDKNILKQIKDKKDIDVSLLRKCKEIQSNILVNEWNVIETSEDVENILSASLGFHDSFVEKIDRINDNKLVEVTFNTTWSCKIIIRFEDEIEFKCEELYGQMGEIFEGSIFFEDRFIFWVDCEIESSKDIKQDFCYFKSRKAYWKIDII